MSKLEIIGVAVAFLLGFAFRWFKLPYLSPPSVAGVLCIAALSLGGVLADRLSK